MKYLTPQLKEKYLKDFTDNVLNCTHEYWKLDDGLRDILIKINDNNNIQTLYSANNNHNGISYIHFLITKDADNDVINKLTKQCKNLFSQLIIEYIGKQEPFKDVEPIGIGCNDDETYMENGYICFMVASDNINKHKQFWRLVEFYLPKV